MTDHAVLCKPETHPYILVLFVLSFGHAYGYIYTTPLLRAHAVVRVGGVPKVIQTGVDNAGKGRVAAKPF